MERSVRHRNQLPTNLPQLQNLIKRDSSLYKDEVKNHSQFNSCPELVMIS